MGISKKINVLDESLRLAWLESSQESDSHVSDKELNIILKGVYNSSMSLDKENLLIDKLFSKFSALSLGQLISNSIQSKSLSYKEVASKTNIPINVLDELKTDTIFPNNIPVIFLKKLLQLLDISFKSADQAVWKTYDIIKSRASISNKYFLQPEPHFRRKQNISPGSLINKNKSTDGSELFENEDSLRKYLNKLENLMNN